MRGEQTEGLRSREGLRSCEGSSRGEPPLDQDRETEQASQTEGLRSCEGYLTVRYTPVFSEVQ